MLLLIKAQAVVLLVLLPRVETDHQVEVLPLAHGGHTVEVLDVDDPDPTQLHVVPADLGTGAVQKRSDPANRHRVVGDETVPAKNEFQGGLALADPAFSQNQHAHAVDVDKRSVQGQRRGQALLEVTPEKIDGPFGRAGCRQERDG